MRMWMVPPNLMCKQHLLGEHVELHMLIGWLNKKKPLGRFASDHLIEPRKIRQRHAALVREMRNRGMNHQSPIWSYSLKYLSRPEREAVVDPQDNIVELRRRCPECRRRINRAIKEYMDV